MDADIIKIITMVLIGAIGGSLAARVVRGSNFGFIVNAILGIAGAVVGSYIFDWLNMTPGSGIVHIISETFGVELPPNLIGLLVSATIGAVVILFIFGLFNGRGRRRRL